MQYCTFSLNNACLVQHLAVKKKDYSVLVNTQSLSFFV